MSTPDASARTDAVTRSDEATEPTPQRSTVRRTVMLLAAVAALAVGAIVAVAVLRPAATERAPTVTADTPALLGDAGAMVGRRVPSATLPPLADLGPDGGLELPAPGAPMVINFWASWCAPCVNEMPMLQRVSDDLDVTMVGVDYIDQSDKAIALARELDITYPLVTDADGEFGQAVRLLGTPTTLIVDSRGIVRRQLTGELTEEQLRAAVADVR
jgi:cytochrome c biogenesis protein CcmG/thiol:disulfide interchange protein DsbE